MQESPPIALAQHQRSARRQVPIPPTPLFGREHEVQTVCALLQRPEVRLLTLTGIAGVGKTRLALQVAADQASVFADGVQFVPLASVSDPDLVLPTIAQTLGLRETSHHPLQMLLQQNLHDQQVLLVLDNFEQVITAASHLAALLAACPDLKLLVTSREVLHLRAEHHFPLHPLPVPRRATRGAPDGKALAENPAVQLFLQRVQATHPAFHLTPDTAAPIAEICRRLEGLPLALELAAPRLKLLSPQALLARLEGRLHVLTGGARDLPERQRTMRATIVWSYELLTPAEQALFRRLAVFVDGWMLEAAEQVCLAAGPLELDLLEGLAALLDKSLLRQEQTHEGETRYRMLYVLREFGIERLAEAGELAAMGQAHADYFLAFVEEGHSPLAGRQQKAWHGPLEQERENLRAALNWWLEHAEQTGEPPAAERALRLCTVLVQMWRRTSIHETRAFLERGLALRMGVTAAVQAKALVLLAGLYLDTGELDRAQALAQESLALARQGGDLEDAALALGHLGTVAFKQDQYALARASLEEAVALHQQTGNDGLRGAHLGDLASLALQQGEYERAFGLQEECLALYQALGDQWRVGWALVHCGSMLCVLQGDLIRAAALNEQGQRLLREAGDTRGSTLARATLAVIRRQQGALAEARSLLEQGLPLLKAQGSKMTICDTQIFLADLLVQQGDLTAAQALYQETRMLLPASGYRPLMAFYLEGLAALKVALEVPEQAAQLWGAASALREALGTPLFPIYRDTYTRAVAAARKRLGDAAFAVAWAEGRRLSPEAALTTWEQPVVESSFPKQLATKMGTSRPQYPAGLTAREVEVLRLVAAGLTDQQAAEKLSIAPRTVNTHLTSIYHKLNVTNRVEATRFAVEYHLV